MKEFINTVLRQISLTVGFCSVILLISQTVKTELAFAFFFSSILLWFFSDWIEEYFERKEDKEKEE